MSFPNWNSVANRNKKLSKDKYIYKTDSYYKNINKVDKLKSKSYTVGQVKTIIKLAHQLNQPEMLKEFKINNQYDAGLAIRRLKALANAV